MRKHPTMRPPAPSGIRTGTRSRLRPTPSGLPGGAESRAGRLVAAGAGAVPRRTAGGAPGDGSRRKPGRLDRSRGGGHGPLPAGSPPSRHEPRHDPKARPTAAPGDDGLEGRRPRALPAGGAMRRGGDRLRRPDLHEVAAAQGETASRGLLRHRGRGLRVGPAPPDEPGGGRGRRRRRPGVGAAAQRRAPRKIRLAHRAGPRRRARRGPRRHGRRARDELQLLGAAYPGRDAPLLREGARCAGRGRRLLPRRLRRLRCVPRDEGDDRTRRLHLRLGPSVVRPHHRPAALPHPLPVSGRLPDQGCVRVRVAAVDAARDPRAPRRGRLP